MIKSDDAVEIIIAELDNKTIFHILDILRSTARSTICKMESVCHKSNLARNGCSGWKRLGQGFTFNDPKRTASGTRKRFGSKHIRVTAPSNSRPECVWESVVKCQSCSWQMFPIQAAWAWATPQRWTFQLLCHFSSNSQLWSAMCWSTKQRFTGVNARCWLTLWID